LIALGWTGFVDHLLRVLGSKVMHRASVFFGWIFLLIVAQPASAVLYSQNFETNTTASWNLNKGPLTPTPVDAAANFFFDYSTVGIPAAPSGAGTRGLKLQVNQASGVFGGMSVSPTGQSFGNQYKLTFDWWANFNGPFPAGGSGSTQLSTYGVGTNGTVAQWPGGTQNSVWFGATGDGNSSQDWRAYSSAAPTQYASNSGVFAAGSTTTPDVRNQNHPYYTNFGANTAPAAQLTMFPQQTGATLVGSAGMEWHQVEIVKSGTDVKWFVGGKLIATVPLSGVTISGGNIFFGQSDINATSSTDPNDVNLLFSLIDNVSVVAIPEPGAWLFGGVATVGAGVAALIRRRKTAA
jgi:hypothetical protein